MANVHPNIKTLAYEDVLAVHYSLVELFKDEDPIEPCGERPGNLVKSAVDRQLVGMKGYFKYNTVFANVASLCYGLCCNHGFHNGNKRTALVCMLVHLDRNGYVFNRTVTPKDLYDFILAMAKGKLHLLDTLELPRRRSRQKKTYERKLREAKPFEYEEALAYTTNWIAKRVRLVKRGEQFIITFRQLNKILRCYGYTITDPDRNTSHVVRTKENVRRKLWGLIQERQPANVTVCTINCGGMNREIPISTVKKVRQACGLTETDGVDSIAFYEGRDPIDFFLNSYRNILKRLSKE